MQNSEHIGRSDQHVGNSAQTHTPRETEEVSFSNRPIIAQIAAEVSRVRSAWLERTAETELTGTSFNDQLIEMLVDTLDAHAKAYLSGVNREKQIPEYIAKLQGLGEALYNDAKQKMHLATDACSENQLLSAESRRKIIDHSVANLLSGRIHGCSDSSFPAGNITGRGAHKIAAATKLAEAQLAKDVERWLETRDEMLFRIEIRFAGRYQYWKAEALKRVREKEEIAGQKGRDPLGVSDWEGVEIEFLSEERVQIRVGNAIENRNHAEMGFVDKRNGKASQSWGILRTFAQCRGVIPESARSGTEWLSHQKQIARMRKTLQEHFLLAGDPVPFIEGIGYRARFKIRCAGSFER